MLSLIDDFRFWKSGLRIVLNDTRPFISDMRQILHIHLSYNSILYRRNKFISMPYGIKGYDCVILVYPCITYNCIMYVHAQKSFILVFKQFNAGKLMSCMKLFKPGSAKCFNLFITFSKIVCYENALPCPLEHLLVR